MSTGYLTDDDEDGERQYARQNFSKAFDQTGICYWEPDLPIPVEELKAEAEGELWHGQCARAVVDNVTYEEGQLSFTVGRLITNVFETHTDGVLHGKLNGLTGVFPASCVEMVIEKPGQLYKQRPTNNGSSYYDVGFESSDDEQAEAPAAPATTARVPGKPSALHWTNNEPPMQGFLTKQGEGYRKAWKKRYMVASPDAWLYYYKTLDELEPLGAIDLRNVAVSEVDFKKKDNCFQIYHPTRRTYFVVAETEAAKDKWIAVIKELSKVPGTAAPVNVDAVSREEFVGDGGGSGSSGGAGAGPSEAPAVPAARPAPTTPNGGGGSRGLPTPPATTPVANGSSPQTVDAITDAYSNRDEREAQRANERPPPKSPRGSLVVAVPRGPPSKPQRRSASLSSPNVVEKVVPDPESPAVKRRSIGARPPPRPAQGPTSPPQKPPPPAGARPAVVVPPRPAAPPKSPSAAVPPPKPSLPPRRPTVSAQDDYDTSSTTDSGSDDEEDQPPLPIRPAKEPPKTTSFVKGGVEVNFMGPIGGAYAHVISGVDPTMTTVGEFTDAVAASIGLPSAIGFSLWVMGLTQEQRMSIEGGWRLTVCQHNEGGLELELDRSLPLVNYAEAFMAAVNEARLRALNPENMLYFRMASGQTYEQVVACMASDNAIRLMFWEMKPHVQSGHLGLDWETAVSAAAYQMQERGDARAFQATDGELVVTLPPNIEPPAGTNTATAVREAWTALSGSGTGIYAMRSFVETLQTCPAFGSVHYSGQLNSVRGSKHSYKDEPIIIGVNNGGIHFVFSTSASTLVTIPFTAVRDMRAAVSRFTLCLVSGDVFDIITRQSFLMLGCAQARRQAVG